MQSSMQRSMQPHQPARRMGWHRRTALAMLCASALGSAFAQTTAPVFRQAGPAAEAMQGDTTVRLAAPNGLPGVPGVPFNPKACPNPQVITLSMPTSGSGPTPAAPNLSDFPAPSTGWQVTGSLFNQTQNNKQFGHTFDFRPPTGQCCQYADGVLTVTYKALSDDASNDGATPFRNGVALTPNNYIWGNTTVAVGTTVTKTYAIPANWIASGRVSFGAQDDTAVLRATLQINGCCLTPTQPAP